MKTTTHKLEKIVTKQSKIKKGHNKQGQKSKIYKYSLATNSVEAIKALAVH